MQYNRDDAGTLHPLPKPSVDTGMGLERIAAVLQGVHSNYEIDLFQDLIKAAARETRVKDLASNSLKVIADHIRATSFLIVDGVIPGNEGRGYVLRRIIRRAIRHGYKLGQTEPFFHRLVEDLARVMGEAYPELVKAKERVARVLKTEEERFAETLEHGMKVLEGALTREDRMLDGETVFQLYDTFGFPVDLTADIARERDVRVDYAGFEAAMQRQRERARAASKFTVSAGVEYSGPADRVPRLRHAHARRHGGGAVPRGNVGRGDRGRRRCGGGARPHAVLRRVRRPGGRPRRARRRERQLQRRGHAEDPGRGVRPQRRTQDRPAARRRPRDGRGGQRGARARCVEPLGDAPDARGAAQGARRARAAEGLAGRCAAHALRFLAQRADDRSAAAPGRGAGQPRECGATPKSRCA